ncbi:type I DNA topoisomerase [Celerinatantimonas diazotrophica]|uniref:DNA topoisomerase 1 n=1 Tax=Celerinatantimonas diazotrophica TaxID=412034 RepID=A0A4R1KGS3_9GAMM|nr:type I DNA topoisomerase [Celerinatantimonas diazotrophica]TCK63904.1 DNA topoisomerase I [Celerinatantimonas diazotrophica]CAG9296989.1 DNA topoisomerase 1 [Celerinatantimonas diazotrophica]
MSKSLVIVESPAKAKTINKYLGNQYVVKSSVGHVRDLPKSGGSSAGKKKADPISTKGLSAEEKAQIKKQREKNALVSRMGIDPEHEWQANYQIVPGKEKVVNELKQLAAKADTIYLATDLDREGEAIAWHLREIIGGDESRFKRVVFNEITKTAIQQAFSKPGELNIARVNAQQARRFLDRVVGYMVSPLLWKKIARGLSAGRVQSVAVRLVVEREREIKAFVPQEYWNIFTDLLTEKKDALRMQVAKFQGKTFEAHSKAEADVALEALKSAKYELTKREDKPTQTKPRAPFITSTLQQGASVRLGYGVKRTMMLAQRLYEAGYITYMRTDSTNLSQDALHAVREFIDSEYGQQYLPGKPNIYSSQAGAQEAHEAIRPSNVAIKSGDLKDVDNDAKKLYELIWRQFVACQMTPAQYDSTTLTVQAGDYELKARGRILRFAGWTKVMPAVSAKKDEEQALPAVQQGDKLNLKAIDPQQLFTKPPARYNEASLVKELEKRGIGRPSTYASIISTIQDRGYVHVEKRRFYAEKMGEIVTDRLCENFPNLLSYDFTANMEAELDEVADGHRDWRQTLDQFYDDFTHKLHHAEDEADGMRANVPVLTDIDCPQCGRKMGIRTASTGVFLGCSGYALPPKERCKCTINLIPGEEVESADEEQMETEALMAKKRCPKCGTAMDSYLIDEHRQLHVCGNNPDCDGYVIEEGNFKLKGYDGPVVECDKCGHDMQLKTGRFGKYMACTNPECKNTRKILKNGEVAPPREDPVHLPELKCSQSDAYFVLRDGASGIFLAANTFPKSRETRAPQVAELVQFKDRISPKFHYLTQAPTHDPDGNPTVVRYSRKNKEQYVMTEVEKKATGWAAYYRDGRWEVSDKRKKKK